MSAEIFAGGELNGPSFRRIDPFIDFDWGQGSPHPEVGAEQFSVRWTGKLKSDEAGLHRLFVERDGGVRVWLDGVLVIDRWEASGADEDSAELSLAVGALHDLRIEYAKRRPTARLKLWWTRPSIAKRIVHRAAMFSNSVLSIDAVSSGRRYEVVHARAGQQLYVDRPHRLLFLSAALAGGELIRAAEEDSLSTAFEHLALSVNRPAAVFVAYDTRSTSEPAWLRSGEWTLTSETFVTRDGSDLSPWRVFRRNVDGFEGPLALGGNAVFPVSHPGAHYVVIAK